MDKQVVLSKLDFGAFYGSLLPSLKINGKSEAQALCPFHADHRPSFSLDLQNGLWKCWAGCGGGDIFSFYQKVKGVTFKTALEDIGQTVGLNGDIGRVVARYEYRDAEGRILYVKERVEPGRDGRSKDFFFKHPEGGKWVLGRGHDPVPYNLPALIGADRVFVVEGEGKAEALQEWELVATCLDSGASSPWREDYLPYFLGKKVIVLPDNDTPGVGHANKIAQALYGRVQEIKVVQIPGVGEGEDVVDYRRDGGTKELLLELIENSIAWRPGGYSVTHGGVTVDTPVQFEPLTSRELTELLGLTIKQDKANKLITFLCELSAYTESSQLNISFNAPSSTGKSYIPTEIAQLFPAEDVIEVGYCSPTAFFHDVGRYDEGKRGYLVDLSRKVLIFLDQPHTLLLQHLRPLLSHDKKEIRLKITDKSQKAGLRTKNIFLKGFPAVIFCTAGLKVDEQEATRFFLLSPEVNQEKIRQAIYEKIQKEADCEAYQGLLENNSKRREFKNRILNIKQANIRDIKIAAQEKITKTFFEKNRVLKPRHQRDVGRILALVKTFALLNLWFRERRGSTIIADDGDIKEAFGLWDTVSESQEANLPPYIYSLYQEIILAAWREKNKHLDGEFAGVVGVLGLTRQEIFRKHHEVYGRMLDTTQFVKQILPMLETAGLVTQEPDPVDKRKMLVYPTTLSHISGGQKYMGLHGGVNSQQKELSI